MDFFTARPRQLYNIIRVCVPIYFFIIYSHIKYPPVGSMLLRALHVVRDCTAVTTSIKRYDLLLLLRRRVRFNDYYNNNSNII